MILSIDKEPKNPDGDLGHLAALPPTNLMDVAHEVR